MGEAFDQAWTRIAPTFGISLSVLRLSHGGECSPDAPARHTRNNRHRSLLASRQASVLTLRQSLRSPER